MDVRISPTGALTRQRFAQLGWLVCAGLAVSVMFAGIEPFMRLVTAACEGSVCLAAQLTPAQITAAQQVGLRLDSSFAQQQVAALLFPAVLGLLIAAFCMWRRPGDPAAVAGAWALMGLGTGEFARALGQQAQILLLQADLIRLAAALGLGLCLCRIPDGRLRAAWIGPVLAGLALAGALVVLAHANAIVQTLWGTLMLGICAASLAAEYRATAGTARQERVRWGMIALALFAGTQLVGRPLRPLPLPSLQTDVALIETLNGITANGMVLVVGAIACLAVALLRDELFDVELVLNRALVYALLSIVVVACYILVVGYLSLLIQSRGNLWVSLLATGVVAALFQPLRAHVQRLVNHLLYGQRAEPYGVVAELGRRLTGSLAPEAVLPAIVETVARALRLPFVAITLGQGDDEVIVAAKGEAPTGIALVSFPLIYQGAEAGRLRVAPRTGEAQVSADDRRLLADLAHQAGVAAHAVRLTNDLRRAREQLVNTREEERRRLRRDLHDSLGPQLASQALTIDTVELLLSRDPAAAAALLREVKTHAQEAIGEIRRVVYELRPPALDDLGLIGALREQAGRWAGGVAMQVAAPAELPPLPAAVEVAAYHIAQEALANVARHAGACHCTVVVTVDEALTLTVTDDGVGIPTGRTAGVGLSSMRERAEELRGTLILETAMGGGTSVRAMLPLGGTRAGAD